jgi:hypothetical protein
MDLVTLALAKKIAAAAVSGISNITSDGDNMIIHTNDGNEISIALPTGKDGENGENGISVVSMTIDDNNHLISTLSDGTEIDAGRVDADVAALEEKVNKISDDIDLEII